MRNWLIYLFIIFSSLSFQNAQPTKWVVVSGCSLKVDGNTNVNNFSCEISNYSQPDTIVILRNNTKGVQLYGNISLDVQKFNCHNPVMTGDLRKTLKAKEFPHLVIRFLTINRYPSGKTNELTKGLVVIELAGISKQFEVDYKTVSATNNFLHLEGSRTIHFSDFLITPPRKLGGMIRTNNELEVVFNLKVKVL